MADGSIPLVLSPEPFSREVVYLAQPAGRTIRAALLDAVKGGAISADDLARTVVYVDGQRLERDKTLDHVLVEGQVVNVVVEPLGGGGRKDVGQVLLTLAVIAVSMWVGAGATVLGTTLLARVAAAAILTLGQAAIASLFAPETDNQAKVNERYALQTASNQYRPWAPMPVALGEVVVAPDFAAKTYTQAVGDDVWLHGILGLHRGPCTVSDLKIGDTLASSMGAGDFRMVQHLTPGPRTFTIYQNDPDQLDLQEELEATTSSATPVVRAGSAEGEQFDFDFFLPGGLHFQKDDGRVLTASVTATIRYRPVDEDGNPTGSGGWVAGLDVALSSTTKEPMRITRSLSLPMGRYEFEIKRSLKPDDNEKRRDRIALTAIRSIAFRNAVADQTLSIIEFAVRATALNQGTLAPITCRIIPICETWNGSAWGAPEPTSNPAALTRWLLTGPAPARPLLPEQADTRLRTWSALCDTHNWRAGIYLLEDRRQDQVIGLLEQAGRASLFWDGTQIVASPWVEKPAPRQLFTGSNLRDHKWTLVYPEPVHALRIEFQNIDEGGDPDELYVYADGYAETAGPGVEAATLIEALRLEGQKTTERAYRDGRWELGARLHRRRIDTWTADVEHLVSGYGDRVRLAWQRIDGGTSSRVRCRRWAGGLVSGVRLAQPVEMRPGEAYAVDIRLTSGVALAVPVINPASAEAVITRELQFSVPRPSEDAPRRDDLIAFGSPSRISEDTELIGVEPGEGLTAVLTGVRYVAPLLMAGETGPIPELTTRLSRQRQANPPTPRLLGVQPDPSGVRVSFSVPPWSGSPIIGFAARWRQTPAAGQEASWLPLPALTAGSTALITPPPRALPVASDDDEGATLIDVEVRALTESGQSSREPMMVSAILVRESPFAPNGLTVTPAIRVAPGGSSHGVLVVAADPLAAAQGVDLILEVRRAPLVGPADDWESAGLPLAAANPTGDVLGLRSGERYGVRAAWRSAAGWLSRWTDEIQATVPAGSSVSDDTNAVDGVGAPELVARLVDAEALVAATDAAVGDLEDVFGDTVSAAASALAADAAAGAAALDQIAAQTARGASENAADAAVTAASVATAEAGQAGLSAAAADASRTAARLTTAALLPSDFRDDSKYWAISQAGSPEYRATTPLPNSFFDIAGAGRVFRSPTDLLDFGPLSAIRVESGRKYRYTVRIRAVTNDPDAQVWLRWIAMGEDYLSAYDFAYSFYTLTEEDGWQTLTAQVVTGDDVLSVGRIYLRPNPILNIGGDGQVFEVAGVRIEDITESDAAEGFADAAALSVTQAEAHSTEAGEHAFAAQGFATEAETQAGHSSTFSGQSAEARDDAVEASTEAGTAALTATAAAATAATESSEANGAAARALASAALAVSVGYRALNRNAGFDDYPVTPGLPTAWSPWGAAGTVTRQPGPTGGYSVLVETGAGNNGGVVQTVPGMPNTYYVVEADLTVASDGSLAAAGLTVQARNTAESSVYQTWTYPLSGADASGNVAGAGVENGRYTYSCLMKTPDEPSISKLFLYGMNKWSAFGSLAAQSRITWHTLLIRPATEQEIAAGVALPALAASFEDTREVVADLEANYDLARLSLAAVSSGGRAVLQILSDTYGTDIALSADKVWYGDNTYFDDATDTLRTVSGGNGRVLALGAAFGTDGHLTQWEGPSTVAFSAMSRANAYFYVANVAPYVGGSGIASPEFRVEASHVSIAAASFAAGNITTGLVILTPSNASATVTYSWSNVLGEGTMIATAPTGASTAFRADPAPGAQMQAVFAWTATDGGTGEVRRGQVFVTIIQNV